MGLNNVKISLSYKDLRASVFLGYLEVAEQAREKEREPPGS